MQLQIEVKQKMLGRSVAFRVKSVKKRPQTKNFFYLTTPNAHKYQWVAFSHQQQSQHHFYHSLTWFGRELSKLKSVEIVGDVSQCL